MRLIAALSAALALMPVAAPQLHAEEPQAPVVAPAPAAIPVATLKSANVRFGPSIKSKITVTLPAGSAVEVFGRAQSAPEWFVVRFPRQGKAWIHQKVLAPVGETGTWKVIVDGARARDDATLGGAVVAELTKGEIVEDRGAVVGDWRSVHIPDAVAYIHGSLLDLPANLDEQFRTRAEKALAADAMWKQACANYAALRDAVTANPKAALGADWAGLVKQFDVVIVDHAYAQTRMQAKLIRDSIVDVVEAATKKALQDGTQPPAAIPAEPRPEAPVKPDPAAVAKPADATAAGPAPLKPGDIKLPPPSPYQAEGLLMANSDYPKVEAQFLVMDGNGDVVAFVNAKDGFDLKLSEIVNREVGIKGMVEQLAPEKTGMTAAVKLISAVAAEPLRR